MRASKLGKECSMVLFPRQKGAHCENACALHPLSWRFLCNRLLSPALPEAFESSSRQNALETMGVEVFCMWQFMLSCQPSCLSQTIHLREILLSPMMADVSRITCIRPRLASCHP